jgi:hypothetical protein
VPERTRWFGGGYDAAGIHSVASDPRDDDRVLVAISCGGVWETRDAGASWSVLGKGLFAPYVPPEHAEDPAIQDPDRVVRCAAAPEVMWMQHHAGICRSIDAGANPPRPRSRRQRRTPGHGLCHRRAMDQRHGGECWELINAHLAPIYAVRFANKRRH